MPAFILSHSFLSCHALQNPCMRVFLASILITGACLALVGCESDVPPAQSGVSGVNKFERGISGQGTLTQPDKSDDPIIKENTRAGY